MSLDEKHVNPWYNIHEWEKVDFKGTPLRYYQPNLDKDKIKSISLYMYVGGEALKNIFSTGKLRISLPWKTNDITEGVVQGKTTQSREVQQFGYICLSSVNNSPAMWGYYADRGRGACLKFDFTVFEIVPDETYEIIEAGMFSLFHRKIIRKVRYEDDRAPDDTVEVLFRKSKNWEHEQEYRILINLNNLPLDNIEYSCSDSSMAEYYDSELIGNLAGVILGVNNKYSITETEALIKKLRCSLLYKRLQFLYYEYQLIGKECYKYNNELARIPGLFNTCIENIEYDSVRFCYNVKIVSEKEVYSARLLYPVSRREDIVLLDYREGNIKLLSEINMICRLFHYKPIYFNNVELLIRKSKREYINNICYNIYDIPVERENDNIMFISLIEDVTYNKWYWVDEINSFYLNGLKEKYREELKKETKRDESLMKFYEYLEKKENNIDPEDLKYRHFFDPTE